MKLESFMSRDNGSCLPISPKGWGKLVHCLVHYLLSKFKLTSKLKHQENVSWTTISVEMRMFSLAKC